MSEPESPSAGQSVEDAWLRWFESELASLEREELAKSKREQPIQGECRVPGCDCHDVYASNSYCMSHNQLLGNFRLWLGLPVHLDMTGLDESNTRIGPFDRQRASIVLEDRFVR
jgi:hypothetical protein